MDSTRCRSFYSEVTMYGFLAMHMDEMRAHHRLAKSLLPIWEPNECQPGGTCPQHVTLRPSLHAGDIRDHNRLQGRDHQHRGHRIAILWPQDSYRWPQDSYRWPHTPQYPHSLPLDTYATGNNRVTHMQGGYYGTEMRVVGGTWHWVLLRFTTCSHSSRSLLFVMNTLTLTLPEPCP